MGARTINPRWKHRGELVMNARGTILVVALAAVVCASACISTQDHPSHRDAGADAGTIDAGGLPSDGGVPADAPAPADAGDDAPEPICVLPVAGTLVVPRAGATTVVEGVLAGPSRVASTPCT